MFLQTVMAHCIHLEEREKELFKKKGVGICHCPCSNLWYKSMQIKRILVCQEVHEYKCTYLPTYHYAVVAEQKYDWEVCVGWGGAGMRGCEAANYSCEASACKGQELGGGAKVPLYSHPGSATLVGIVITCSQRLTQ